MSNLLCILVSSLSLPAFCSLIYLSELVFPPKNHYKSKKLNVRTKYNIKRSPNIVHPPYSLIISTFHIRECQTYLVK